MTGATGVMVVILLETAVGGAVVLWASGTWGVVRRGFFLLTGVTVALCAVGAALTAGVGIAEAERAVAAGRLVSAPDILGAPGDRMMLGLWVFAGLTILWQALLVANLRTVSRFAGYAATAAGVVALVLFGLARGPQPVIAVAELVAGATFLGSTLFGLLLGHWYLVERRLSKQYMIRGAYWYIGGVVAAIAGVVLSAQNPQPDPTLVSPLLAIEGFTTMLAGGLVAICALISGFTWKLAHEGGRSIQAATGMFYLAVILAFSAELATKTRFFPIQTATEAARLLGG